MQAIILSAGAGSRLLPLTRAMPKCLVAVGGRAILDAQLDALAAAGLNRAAVVAGYRAAQVAEHLAARRSGPETRLVLNPFWRVSSSIGSVWAARHLLTEDFAILNGDTVFDPAVLAGAIARAQGLGLLVEAIAAAQTDDMLVTAKDGRVRAVGKHLALAAATHRSLGVVMSVRDGGRYRAALDRVIAREDGIDAYHHDVVDLLAQEGEVAALEAPAGHWQEIDRPEDIAAWEGVHRGG